MNLLKSRERFASRVPGEGGIWLLVAGDMLTFSLFFGTYLFYRGQNAVEYTHAQSHLRQAFGAANTLLMLTSSWLVANGVQTARGQLGSARGWLAGALVAGLGFVLLKVIEYTRLILAGDTLNGAEFFIFYYGFTGIHLLHVLVGLVVLTLMIRALSRQPAAPHLIRNLESGALFWHAVDVIWIFLFPLLYLIR